MPEPYLRLDDERLKPLLRYSGPKLSVLMAVISLANRDGKVAATYGELARMTGIDRISVLVMMEELARDDKIHSPLIYKGKKKNTWVVPVTLTGNDEKTIVIEPDPDPEQRVIDLEAEVTRLSRQLARYKTGETSGALDDMRPGRARDVVIEAIELVGRDLTPLEFFYLGELIGQYDPERVLTALRGKAKAPNPLRAVYGYLKNNALGKRRPTPPEANDGPTYVRADEVGSPWDN